MIINISAVVIILNSIIITNTINIIMIHDSSLIVLCRHLPEGVVYDTDV
jgi:hypothetical protein